MTPADQARDTRRSLRDVGLFVLASAAVPFLVTAMFRLWTEVHLVVPSALLTLVGALLWWLKPRARAAAYGLWTGCALWLLFLLWLFHEMGRGLGEL